MFNLRHASARNVIERIFGVLKRRYRILQIAPEYAIEIQARIPCALAALHNFIRENDEDILDFEDALADEEGHGGTMDPDEDASSQEAADDDEPSALRDSIADAMWAEYITICEERGLMDEEEDDLGYV